MADMFGAGFKFNKDGDLYEGIQQRLQEVLETAGDSSSSCLITTTADSKFGEFKARLVASKCGNKLITKLEILDSGRASESRVGKIQSTFKDFCAAMDADIQVCEESTLDVPSLLKELSNRMRGRHLNKSFYVQTASGNIAEVITRKVNLEGEDRIALEINGSAVSAEEASSIVDTITIARKVVSVAKNGLLKKVSIDRVEDIPDLLTTSLPISRFAPGDTVEFHMPGPKVIKITQESLPEGPHQLSIRVEPKDSLTAAEVSTLQQGIDSFNTGLFDPEGHAILYTLTSMRNSTAELIKNFDIDGTLSGKFNAHFLTPIHRTPLVIKSHDFKETLIRTEIKADGTVRLMLSEKLDPLTIYNILNSIDAKGKIVSEISPPTDLLREENCAIGEIAARFRPAAGTRDFTRIINIGDGKRLVLKQTNNNLSLISASAHVWDAAEQEELKEQIFNILSASAHLNGNVDAAVRGIPLVNEKAITSFANDFNPPAARNHSKLFRANGKIFQFKQEDNKLIVSTPNALSDLETQQVLAEIEKINRTREENYLDTQLIIQGRPFSQVIDLEILAANILGRERGENFHLHFRTPEGKKVKITVLEEHLQLESTSELPKDEVDILLEQLAIVDELGISCSSFKINAKEHVKFLEGGRTWSDILTPPLDFPFVIKSSPDSRGFKLKFSQENAAVDPRAIKITTNSSAEPVADIAKALQGKGFSLSSCWMPGERRRGEEGEKVQVLDTSSTGDINDISKNFLPFASSNYKKLFLIPDPVFVQVEDYNLSVNLAKDLPRDQLSRFMQELHRAFTQTSTDQVTGLENISLSYPGTIKTLPLSRDIHDIAAAIHHPSQARSILPYTIAIIAGELVLIESSQGEEGSFHVNIQGKTDVIDKILPSISHTFRERFMPREINHITINGDILDNHFADFTQAGKNFLILKEVFVGDCKISINIDPFSEDGCAKCTASRALSNEEEELFMKTAAASLQQVFTREGKTRAIELSHNDGKRLAYFQVSHYGAEVRAGDIERRGALFKQAGHQFRLYDNTSSGVRSNDSSYISPVLSISTDEDSRTSVQTHETFFNISEWKASPWELYESLKNNFDIKFKEVKILNRDLHLTVANIDEAVTLFSEYCQKVDSGEIVTNPLFSSWDGFNFSFSQLNEAGEVEEFTLKLHRKASGISHAFFDKRGSFELSPFYEKLPKIASISTSTKETLKDYLLPTTAEGIEEFRLICETGNFRDIESIRICNIDTLNKDYMLKILPPKAGEETHLLELHAPYEDLKETFDLKEKEGPSTYRTASALNTVMYRYLESQTAGLMPSKILSYEGRSKGLIHTSEPTVKGLIQRLDEFEDGQELSFVRLGEDWTPFFQISQNEEGKVFIKSKLDMTKGEALQLKEALETRGFEVSEIKCIVNADAPDRARRVLDNKSYIFSSSADFARNMDDNIKEFIENERRGMRPENFFLDEEGNEMAHFHFSDEQSSLFIELTASEDRPIKNYLPEEGIELFKSYETESRIKDLHVLVNGKESYLYIPLDGDSISTLDFLDFLEAKVGTHEQVKELGAATTETNDLKYSLIYSEEKDGCTLHIPDARALSLNLLPKLKDFKIKSIVDKLGNEHFTSCENFEALSAEIPDIIERAFDDSRPLFMLHLKDPEVALSIQKISSEQLNIEVSGEDFNAWPAEIIEQIKDLVKAAGAENLAVVQDGDCKLKTFFNVEDISKVSEIIRERLGSPIPSRTSIDLLDPREYVSIESFYLTPEKSKVNLRIHCESLELEEALAAEYQSYCEDRVYALEGKKLYCKTFDSFALATDFISTLDPLAKSVAKNFVVNVLGGVYTFTFSADNTYVISANSDLQKQELDLLQQTIKAKGFELSELKFYELEKSQVFRYSVQPIIDQESLITEAKKLLSPELLSRLEEGLASVENNSLRNIIEANIGALKSLPNFTTLMERQSELLKLLNVATVREEVDELSLELKKLKDLIKKSLDLSTTIEPCLNKLILPYLNTEPVGIREKFFAMFDFEPLSNLPNPPSASSYPYSINKLSNEFVDFDTSALCYFIVYEQTLARGVKILEKDSRRNKHSSVVNSGSIDAIIAASGGNQATSLRKRVEALVAAEKSINPTKEELLALLWENGSPLEGAPSLEGTEAWDNHFLKVTGKLDELEKSLDFMVAHEASLTTLDSMIGLYEAPEADKESLFEAYDKILELASSSGDLQSDLEKGLASYKGFIEEAKRVSAFKRAKEKFHEIQTEPESHKKTRAYLSILDFLPIKESAPNLTLRTSLLKKSRLHDYLATPIFNSAEFSELLAANYVPPEIPEEATESERKALISKAKKENYQKTLKEIFSGEKLDELVGSNSATFQALKSSLKDFPLLFADLLKPEFYRALDYEESLIYSMEEFDEYLERQNRFLQESEKAYQAVKLADQAFRSEILLEQMLEESKTFNRNRIEKSLATVAAQKLSRKGSQEIIRLLQPILEKASIKELLIRHLNEATFSEYIEELNEKETAGNLSQDELILLRFAEAMLRLQDKMLATHLIDPKFLNSTHAFCCFYLASTFELNTFEKPQDNRLKSILDTVNSYFYDPSNDKITKALTYNYNNLLQLASETPEFLLIHLPYYLEENALRSHPIFYSDNFEELKKHERAEKSQIAKILAPFPQSRIAEIFDSEVSIEASQIAFLDHLQIAYKVQFRNESLLGHGFSMSNPELLELIRNSSKKLLDLVEAFGDMSYKDGEEAHYSAILDEAATFKSLLLEQKRQNKTLHETKTRDLKVELRAHLDELEAGSFLERKREKIDACLQFVRDNPIDAEFDDDRDELRQVKHIINDGTMGASEYEGSRLSKTAKFTKLFYQKLKAEESAVGDEKKHLLNSPYQAADFPAELDLLVNSLDQIANIHKKVLETPERRLIQSEVLPDILRDLNNKGRCFLPGGFSKSPAGHAMAYEISKEADGSISFCVYNTGLGITKHYSMHDSTNKRRHYPILGYKIPGDAVMDGDAFKAPFQRWLSNILSMLISSKDNNIDTLYSSVSSGIQYLFNGTAYIPLDKCTRLISGQKEGTCSQQVLRPVTNRHLRNLEDYKQATTEFQLRVLIESFNKHKGDLKSSLLWRETLRNGSKKLSIRLLKLYLKEKERADTPEKAKKLEEYEDILATISFIKKEIDQAEADHTDRSLSLKTHRVVEKDLAIFDRPIEAKREISYKDPEAAIPNTLLTQNFPSLNLSLGTPAEIKAALPTLKRDLQLIVGPLLGPDDAAAPGSEKVASYKNLYLFAEQIAKRLPVPSVNQTTGAYSYANWPINTPEEIQALEDALQFMSELGAYLATSQRYRMMKKIDRHTSAETMVNLYTLQAVTYSLSCCRLKRPGDAKSPLENYYTTPKGFDYFITLPTWQLSKDPEMHKRYLEVTGFFKEKRKPFAVRALFPLTDYYWAEGVEIDGYNNNSLIKLLDDLASEGGKYSDKNGLPFRLNYNYDPSIFDGEVFNDISAATKRRFAAYGDCNRWPKPLKQLDNVFRFTNLAFYNDMNSQLETDTENVSNSFYKDLLRRCSTQSYNYTRPTVCAQNLCRQYVLTADSKGIFFYIRHESCYSTLFEELEVEIQEPIIKKILQEPLTCKRTENKVYTENLDLAGDSQRISRDDELFLREMMRVKDEGLYRALEFISTKSATIKNVPDILELIKVKISSPGLLYKEISKNPDVISYALDALSRACQDITQRTPLFHKDPNNLKVLSSYLYISDYIHKMSKNQIDEMDPGPEKEALLEKINALSNLVESTIDTIFSSASVANETKAIFSKVALLHTQTKGLNSGDEAQKIKNIKYFIYHSTFLARSYPDAQLNSLLLERESERALYDLSAEFAKEHMDGALSAAISSAIDDSTQKTIGDAQNIIDDPSLWEKLPGSTSPLLLSKAGFILNLSTGELIKEGMEVRELPKSVKEQTIGYRKAFGDKLFSTSICRNSGKLYELKHNGDDYRLVKGASGNYSIQRKLTIKVEGMEAPQEVFGQLEENVNVSYYKKIPDFLRCERFASYFCKEPDRIVILDQTTNTPVSLIDSNGKMLKYKKETASFGPFELIATSSVKDEWGSSSFEDARLALNWKNPTSGEVIIEFPRFEGITLKGTGSLNLEQMPGYTLITDSSKVATTKLRINGAIHLVSGDPENPIATQESKQKILLPCGRLYTSQLIPEYDPSTGYPLFKPQHIFNQGEEKEAFSSSVYKVHRGHFELSIVSGQPMPKDTEMLEGSLYLMYLALIHRQHDQVAFYFNLLQQHLHSNAHFTPFVENIFQAIAELQEHDSSPNTVTWQIKILLLAKSRREVLIDDKQTKKIQSSKEKYKFSREFTEGDQGILLEKRLYNSFFSEEAGEDEININECLEQLASKYFTTALSFQEVAYQLTGYERRYIESLELPSIKVEEEDYTDELVKERVEAEPKVIKRTTLARTINIDKAALSKVFSSRAISFSEIKSLSHPGEDMGAAFIHLYEMAVTGTAEEKAALREFLLYRLSEESDYKEVNDSLSNILFYLLNQARVAGEIPALSAKPECQSVRYNIKNKAEARAFLADKNVGDAFYFYDTQAGGVITAGVIGEISPVTGPKILFYSPSSGFVDAGKLFIYTNELRDMLPSSNHINFLPGGNLPQNISYIGANVGHVQKQLEIGTKIEINKENEFYVSEPLSITPLDTGAIIKKRGVEIFYTHAQLARGVNIGNTVECEYQVGGLNPPAIRATISYDEMNKTLTLEAHNNIDHCTRSRKGLLDLMDLFEETELPVFCAPLSTAATEERRSGKEEVTFENLRSYSPLRGIYDSFSYAKAIGKAGYEIDETLAEVQFSRCFDGSKSFPVYRPLSDISANLFDVHSEKLDEEDRMLALESYRQFYNPEAGVELSRKSISPTPFSDRFKEFSKQIEPQLQPSILAKLQELDKDYLKGWQSNSIEKQERSFQIKMLMKSNAEGKIEPMHWEATSKADEHSIELKLKEQEILLLAKKNLESIQESHSSAWKREEVSFDKVVKLYLQEDMTAFRDFLALESTEKIQELNHKITEYLLLKTRCQQLLRVVDATYELMQLNPETAEEETVAQAYIELAESLSASRHYHPFAAGKESKIAKACLFYESASGFLLRKKQVEIFKKFLSEDAEGNFENIVDQMIMGGGKSKVLLPLLAFCKARGDNLVAIMVPKALYETNRADLSSTALEFFGQSSYTLEFTRQTPHTSSSLSKLKEKLELCILDHSFLIVDDETFQNIELTYIEWMENVLEGTATPEEIERTKVLKDIYIMLTESDVLMDEIDTILDTRTELNFPIGNSKEYLNINEFRLIENIYASFEDLPIAEGSDKTFKGYLDQNLQNEISLVQFIQSRKPLATSVLDKPIELEYANEVGEKVTELTTLWSRVKHFDTTINKDAVIRFLTGATPPKSLEDKVLDVEEPTEEIKNLAALLFLAREEISSIQKDCLKRNAKEHYGISKELNEGTEERYADDVAPETSPTIIPFKAAQTPSEGSLFSSPYESCTFAAQAYRTMEISKAETRNFVEDLIKKARKECEIGVRLEETPTVIKFRELFAGNIVEGEDVGDLLRYTSHLETRIPQFQEVLNLIKKDNREVLHYFLETRVHPQLFAFKYKLRSTPQNHAQIPRSIQGFTGTPWNRDSYNPRIKSAVELGVDGTTIDHMIQKQGVVMSVDTTKDVSALTLLNADREQNTAEARKPLRAIIDTAALLKNYSNKQVAEDLLEALTTEAADNPHYSENIKGIIYFDDTKNTLHVLKKGEETPIEIGSSEKSVIKEKTGLLPEDLFVYFSQKHTTGTDIKLTKDARALGTISNNTFLRDLLQGVMRLRGFSKGQSCDYIIPKSLKEEAGIGDAIDCITTTILSQAKQQAQENIQGACQNIHNAFRAPILQQLQRLKIKEAYTAEEKKIADFLLTQLKSIETLDPKKLFEGTKQMINTRFYLESIEKNIRKLIQEEREAALESPEDNARYLEALLDIEGKFQATVNDIKLKILPRNSQAKVPKTTLCRTKKEVGNDGAVGGSVQVQVQVQVANVEEEEEQQQNFRRFASPVGVYSRPYPQQRIRVPITFASLIEDLGAVPFDSSKQGYDLDAINLGEGGTASLYTSHCFRTTASGLPQRMFQKSIHKVLQLVDTSTGRVACVALSEEDFKVLEEKEVFNHPTLGNLKLTLTNSEGVSIRKTKGYIPSEEEKRFLSEVLEKAHLVNGNLELLLRQRHFSNWLKTIDVSSLQRYLEDSVVANRDPYKAPLATALMHKLDIARAAEGAA